MIPDFFIACSGANREVLKDCPTERSKFAGIGATIFFTAILASISGGYAIYFTFNNILIAVLFGMLWGLIIFNLDRYIVSSIKKTGSTKNELLMALPRLLIAIILAVSISKPLEIKLFGGTISKRMGELQDTYNKDCENDFTVQRSALDTKKSGLATELSVTKNNIFLNDAIFKDLDNQKTNKTKQNEGLSHQIAENFGIIEKNSRIEEIIVNHETGATRRVWRRNTLALNKIAENKRLKEDISANNQTIATLAESMKTRQADLVDQVKATETQYGVQIAGVQKQIDDLNARRPEILAKCRTDASLDTDILGKLRALSQLKSFGNTVWWTSLLITLLFIFLETAPVLVKLLSKRGPYDEILDRIEYEIFLKQQTIISDKNEEVNNLIEEIKEANKMKGVIRLQVEKAKLDAELKSNEDILMKIADKQVSLAEIAIENWYREEMTKMKSDTHSEDKDAAKQNNNISLEGKLWKTLGPGNITFYFFKNGQPGANELIYLENGNNHTGTWEYITYLKSIKIDILNTKYNYDITDLSSKSVKLSDATGNTIEFIQA